ncbi:MAG: protein translocase subunit SecF [Chloroflexi bacterium]|nr:protein translocase subunit SecF [Chloroflexota bacterium]
MNIIKNRYVYFLISLLVIIPGIIFMGLNWSKTKTGPLPLGIDFRGGSLLEVQFEGTRPSVEEISALYKEFSTTEEAIAEPVIQPLGEDSFAIRSKTMTDETKGRLVTEMETRFGSKVTLLNFTSVSPSIGAEVTRAAGWAILFAAVAILLYIWWAFRSVEHPYRYGTAAILAMLHDVFVVLGTEAILGYFLGWEADALFLTALLTVIGFSVHDTIVVFDRVRENSNTLRRVEYETMVNHSIVQTLDRSITTQLTVMLTLFALVLFGGDSTRHFVLILLVGIFSGTYSSIFNAAPILVVWENHEWQTWFGRKETS